MVRRRIPEPPEPPRDDGLEMTIADLIKRKYALPKDSPEYLLLMRELAGLRYSYEMAAPIMEDLDPWEWGAFKGNLGPRRA
jgi:hypothetical protein